MGCDDKPMNKVQAGRILCYFALTLLKNKHHFLNLCDNVWFDVMWYGRYAIIFI